MDIARSNKISLNSWLLSITRKRAKLLHGTGVESNDDFFFEGAWSGDYSASGLMNSDFICGSGGVFTKKNIYVFSPSHALECIYLFIQRDELQVSNSIHLILALDEHSKMPNLTEVRQAAHTKHDGIFSYKKLLFENAHGYMLQVMNGMVTIDTNSLAFSESNLFCNQRKNLPTYTHYKSYLMDVVSSLHSNAKNNRRQRKYNGIITTCSSGYDSAACAAIASTLGANDALTISTGRGGADDSGKGVAESLGLRCFEYERFASAKERKKENGDYYIDYDQIPDGMIDFLGSLAYPEDMVFSVFEEHLLNRIVLTGYHGDKIWDIKCSSGFTVKRGDNSGSSLDEFRKRVGFVNIPVPFIGASNFSDIAKISSSPEMKDWSVGGWYDRPIPRRIAEEAGVPRDQFGKKKVAGSALLVIPTAQITRCFYDLVERYRRSGLKEWTNLTAGVGHDEISRASGSAEVFHQA